MTAQSSKSPPPRQFFETHPVFRTEEFVWAHTAGGRSPITSARVLSRNVSRGRLIRVRRGLYATVPSGADLERFLPDPYLVASRAREDAVLAYHTALAFHGRAYSDWSRFQYITAERTRAFSHRGVEFVAVTPPLAVRGVPDRGGEIVERPHAGMTVRVTSLARCVVDLFDAPEHGGGWEEIWRSLEMIEFVDLDAVVRYATRLGSALTVARVGFFLDQHRDVWKVRDDHLSALSTLTPAQPRYLGRDREAGTLVHPWNLIVPAHIRDRRWEEPG
jgi:predicted transcriptional regulator of viral defense system